MELTKEQMKAFGDYIENNTQLGIHGLRQDGAVTKLTLVVLMAFSRDIESILPLALDRLAHAVAHKVNDHMKRTGEEVTELVWGIGNGRVTFEDDDEMMVPDHMMPVRFEVEIGWEFNSISMRWIDTEKSKTVANMTLNQADKWLGQSPRKAPVQSDSL